MEDLKTKINGWIQEYIGDGPIFLVDLSISKGLKRSLVTILVDTMEGITIDACALMSRKLAHHMEENLWIEEAYNLEVTGIEVVNVNWKAESPKTDAPTKIQNSRE